MKIAQKWMLAVTASLSMGTAMAASASTETFLSGHGFLNFENNFLRQQQMLRISTSSSASNQASAFPNTASYDPVTRTAALTFDSASISEVDGKVSFSAGNSLLQLYTFQYLDDGNGDYLTVVKLITLKNIAVDLSDASVSADVASYSGSIGNTSLVNDFGRLTVFTGIAPIADGTQGLIINGEASGSTIGGLTITPQARDIVIPALYALPGMDAAPAMYLIANTMDWGVAGASGTFASSVPEASTQALMLVGLLPILVVSARARRR